MPLSLLRPPQLIGRSRSLDALLAGWYAGQVLCVSGTAGMGKSRLLAELAAATTGAVSTAARPGDPLQPYVTLCRVVLATLDRCPEPPDPQALQQAARLLPALAPRATATPEPLLTAHQRDQALQAACALLQHGARAGCDCLILDDLQWADLASVEALPALLACRGPALRLAFGERRGEESAAARGLLDGLAAQGRLVQVELEPLAQPEVTALLASLALPGIDVEPLALGLRRRVGGNPAFLLEALKLLLSLGPGALARPDLLPMAPGIEAVVRRRLDLLTPQARQVAQLAAVAGPVFGPALATQVLGLQPADLELPMRELEQRQVLYGRRFVHDLVAGAVAQAIAPDTALQLHRGVAQALKGQDIEIAVEAGHWQACEDWLQAGRCYCAAAEAARLALRPVERSQRLDAAIDCLARTDAQAELFNAIATRLNVAEAPDRGQTRGPLIQRLQELARSPEQELRALAQRLGWYADNGRQDGLERVWTVWRVPRP